MSMHRWLSPLFFTKKWDLSEHTYYSLTSFFHWFVYQEQTTQVNKCRSISRASLQTWLSSSFLHLSEISPTSVHTQMLEPKLWKSSFTILHSCHPIHHRNLIILPRKHVRCIHVSPSLLLPPQGKPPSSLALTIATASHLVSHYHSSSLQPSLLHNKQPLRPGDLSTALGM